MFGRCPEDAAPSLWHAEGAAQKTAAATTARFGIQNELDDHGESAACRNWGSEANTCHNYGVEGVARHGILWSPAKRPLKWSIVLKYINKYR